MSPMARVGLVASNLALLVASAACGGSSGDPPGADTDAEPTGTAGSESSGTADAESTGTTDTESTGTAGAESTGTTGEPPIDPNDPLAACAELPAGADWVRGEDLVSIAESTPERIAAAGAQTWPLALELMRVISAQDADSVAASPTSMYASMGLAYGRWQDASCGERIAEVMAFPETGDDLHHTLGASILALESRELEATDDADPVAISLRQSVWAFGDDLPPPTPMLEIYGASQNLLATPDADARDLINCVIDVQSQGLLPEFIPEGEPKADTTSYDINVAFLQAPWASEMVERELEFHFADGTTGPVDGFGSPLADVLLHQSEAFVSVEIPLRGGELAVLAVVPPAGTTDIAPFVESLDAEALALARTEAHPAYVDLTIPKVAIESKTFDYNEGRLDFGCELFTLRAVLHGAAVAMDEKGIKAVAATVAEGWDSGGEEPVPELVLDIDRPFLFFVYDRATEYVLYSGRYAPSQVSP